MYRRDHQLASSAEDVGSDDAAERGRTVTRSDGRLLRSKHENGSGVVFLCFRGRVHHVSYQLNILCRVLIDGQPWNLWNLGVLLRNTHENSLGSKISPMAPELFSEQRQQLVGDGGQVVPLVQVLLPCCTWTRLPSYPGKKEDMSRTSKKVYLYIPVPYPCCRELKRSRLQASIQSQ